MPADPPSQVQITVTVVPRIARAAAWRKLGLLALILAVVPAAVLLAGSRGSVRAPAPEAAVESPGIAARAPRVQLAQVAAAFGYPARCLTITTAGQFARAHVNRAGGCGRYRGYVNASFHLVGGHWRLILDEGQLFVPNALLVGRR